MEYKINEMYYGFKLENKYPVQELDSIAHIFKHEKSGARLMYLQNDDDNKVFSVAFRTPPSDSTGVPHIVEHCVLSGSRKYKTKEPFMDMVKGSLKTFINAMTFSDKTIYPVASRNEKDFFNLMDVYLDSVFFPMIYNDPEIFMQEGWHYDIHDKNDPIKYTGVVYNEMRGAYSTPDTILDDAISEALYPDTCYSHSSGGNPDFIPDLTHEAFTDFHKKYYHPSNSYIYLYGNGDIENHLKHIDNDYLSHFDAAEVTSEIITQRPLKSRVNISKTFPISVDEKDTHRDYLALCYDMGLVTDPIDYLTAQILKHALVTSTAAPLKKALADAQIGEDISATLTDGIHSGLAIIAKNTSSDRAQDFENVITTALMQLVNNGIDKDLIQSSINIVEYDMREASRFPTKGIIYHINSMQSWLYTDNPTMYLEYNPILKELSRLLETDHYEKFVSEKLLNNKHTAFVELKPEKGLGEKKSAALEERLKKYKASLSEKEIEDLIAANHKLRQKQVSPDSPEALATIPQLEVSDVDPVAEDIPQTVYPYGPATLLHHDIFSNDIGYVDYIFDLSPLSYELVPYANLLTYLITKVDTHNRSYVDLTKEIFKYTGGVTLQALVYSANDTDATYYPRVAVRTKAIGDNISRLNGIIKELVLESKLDDKKRLKELIQQAKSRMETAIMQNGNSYAGRRASSYYSPITKYTEGLTGLDFFWFLSDLADNFDKRSDDLVSNLTKAYTTIFNMNNLVVSFTGVEEDFKTFKDSLSVLENSLSHELRAPAQYQLDFTRTNEGIATSGNVQYVAKASNYRKYGYDYHGSINVLSIILNSEYLHDRVRAKGGAYGCNISASHTGNIQIASYRDPNLKETLTVYDETADYVESLDIEQDALTKYIIGAISKQDAALTPHMKGRTATANYISGISYEEIQKERDEILATTPQTLRSYGKLLRQVMQDDYKCVIGNDRKIKDNSDVFNSIVPLKK